MDIDTDTRPLCSDRDHWMTLYMFRQRSPNKIFRIVDLKNMIRYVGTFMGPNVPQPPLQNLSKRILKLNLIRTLTNVCEVFPMEQNDIDAVKVLVRRLEMYGLNFMEPNLVHNFNELFNVVVGNLISRSENTVANRIEIKLKLNNLAIATTNSDLFELPNNHNTVDNHNDGPIMDSELDILSSLTLRLFLGGGSINPDRDGIVLVRHGPRYSDDPAYKEQPIQKNDESVNGSDMVNCKICFENVANIAIKKCGHIFCGSCMDRLDNKCGLCRTTFRGTTDLLNLYFN